MVARGSRQIPPWRSRYSTVACSSVNSTVATAGERATKTRSQPGAIRSNVRRTASRSRRRARFRSTALPTRFPTTKPQRVPRRLFPTALSATSGVLQLRPSRRARWNWSGLRRRSARFIVTRNQEQRTENKSAPGQVLFFVLCSLLFPC